MRWILSNRIKEVSQFCFGAMLLVILVLGCSNPKATKLNGLSLTSPGVTYHPRAFLPTLENPGPTRQQVIEDLRLLRKIGFRSLVTYGADSTMGHIPGIARQEGFDGLVIMGIWNPLSEQEWRNALAEAPFVDGYCLGNEGLGVRYSPDELASRMTELRRLTGHPVTTSEPIASYLGGPYRDWLLVNSDWLFPIAHPFLAGQGTTDSAVDWVVALYDYLTATSKRQVIIKETGFPSAGSKICSEEIQLSFFRLLETKGIQFFYFEAFDQPWKKEIRQHEVEAHWGLFRADSTPKKVISWFANRTLRSE